MLEVFATICVLILGVIVVLAITFMPSRNDSGKSSVAGTKSKIEGFIQSKDFYIYNYYLVPVDVKIIPPGETKEQLVAASIMSHGRTGVHWSQISKVLQRGAVVRVYTRKTGSVKETLIGESVLTIPSGTTIKALHVGMSSGHEDLSMAGEGTKSTLGTAIPRLRIVNASPRCVVFNIGADSVKISPRSSHLYYGENNMGIHLGVVIRDQDGIFSNYTVNKPITDLHFGLISDTETPLYSGSKFGGDFDDTVEVPNHLLEIYGMGGPHSGASRDLTRIL